MKNELLESLFETLGRISEYCVFGSILLSVIKVNDVSETRLIVFGIGCFILSLIFNTLAWYFEDKVEDEK